MKQEYLQELFSFQVGHRHLTNITSGYFQMEPTDEGLQTLNSYGLYFKPQEKGFVVVAPCIQHLDTGLLELQNQFVGSEKLTFAVFTTDKTFFDHSDLSYDPPGEYVYYFNNLDENTRRTRLLLNNCGIKTSERVALHTKQFSGEIVRNAKNEMLLPSVSDCQGNSVPVTQYDFKADEYYNTYSLDLSRLPDGLYTVTYNAEAITYYCTKASLIRRIPLVILEIFVGPEVSGKYQVVQRTNGVQYIDCKKFSLYFGILSYYWQYKIIPIETPAYTWLEVKTNQNGYTFTPDKTEINSYLDPVTFTSEQLIETPSDDLTISLYRLNWNDQCRLTGTNKYKYCNHDYGIDLNSDFWCRQLVNNAYPYKCPARYTEVLIGPLPQADEIPTKYYTDGDKSYAQMTLYLVYTNGQYVMQETYEPQYFTYNVIEGDGDVTVQFINKVDMSSVDLYYTIVNKVSQQSMHMNKVGSIYQMEKIVTRFCYSKLQQGDRIVFWFIYQLSTGEKYTSDKYSHLFQISL